MMRKWKYPAAALLLGAALALWPAGTAEAFALTGLSMEYTREETEYARVGTAGRIPDARAAAPENNPGETLPVSAASNASDGNAAVKKAASNASDGSAAVKKAASALRGHPDSVSLSGASKGASKESGEKKQKSKFQLPQFISDTDFHFDPANEKKELGKAISKLDELGISPEKLVVRFWDFITHKENLEKIGKTAHDLKENAGELIEQATGGNGDSGNKSEKSGTQGSGNKSDGEGRNSGDKGEKSGSRDSGNSGDGGSASAEKDNGSDIDRVKDKVKEEVDRKTEEAIDKAAETAGEIAAREIDKAAETAGQLVGQEIDKAAEKVKEEVCKSKK